MVKLSIVYPHIIPSLLIELSANSTQPTSTMYNAIARIAITSSNLEQLVLIIHEMLERDITVNAAMLKHFVRLACEWGCPRLALQIAERVETKSREGQRVDTAIWIQILIASVDNQFVGMFITPMS